MRRLFWPLYVIAVSSAFYLSLIVLLLVLRLKPRGPKPRLVWGATPILNYKYWSLAMRETGYSSTTFMKTVYSTINKREDWDLVLSEMFGALPSMLKPFAGFLYALWKFDVFFISFDGFLLGSTFLKRQEPFFLKLFRKKVVVLTYGSDAYVYGSVRSSALTHALLTSYPLASRQQSKIQRQVDIWTEHADFILPGVMGIDGIGRWSVTMASTLHIDTKQWIPSVRRSPADGVGDTVYVAHSPNHRGFKGTEFIIEAVANLKRKGLKVELLLIERMQKAEVKELLRTKADILIEQLIFTGHGLSGLEGMASGLPVISNLEDDQYLLPFRRWSYFSECPIVSASPESVESALELLVRNPALRLDLGRAGRQYVEKHHGLDSASYLFSKIAEASEGPELLNLYHPLLGSYPNKSRPVSNPLKNNKLHA